MNNPLLWYVCVKIYVVSVIKYFIMASASLSRYITVEDEVGHVFAYHTIHLNLIYECSWSSICIMYGEHKHIIFYTDHNYL